MKAKSVTSTIHYPQGVELNKIKKSVEKLYSLYYDTDIEIEVSDELMAEIEDFIDDNILHVFDDGSCEDQLAVGSTLIFFGESADLIYVPDFDGAELLLKGSPAEFISWVSKFVSKAKKGSNV